MRARSEQIATAKLGNAANAACRSTLVFRARFRQGEVALVPSCPTWPGLVETAAANAVQGIRSAKRRIPAMRKL
jgi:hypothetical protein